MCNKTNASQKIIAVEMLGRPRIRNLGKELFEDSRISQKTLIENGSFIMIVKGSISKRSETRGKQECMRIFPPTPTHQTGRAVKRSEAVVYGLHWRAVGVRRQGLSKENLSL